MPEEEKRERKRQMSKKVDDSFFEDETAEAGELSLFGRIRKSLKGIGKKKPITDPEDEGFYGAASVEEESNPYGEAQESKSKKRKGSEKKKSRQEFTWWEWLIILIEIALVVYTVLVFLNIAPIF